MNCNIIKNNNKNELSSANSTDNFKNFSDKNFNRYKTRSQMENNNSQCKTYRYKYKKYNKRSDETLPTDCDISKSNHNNLDHDKLEPFKFANGNDIPDYHLFGKNDRFSPEKMFELNKRKFNVSSSYSPKLEDYTVEFDRNLESNATIVEQAKLIATDILNNPMSMENRLKKSNQEECTHVIKSEKRKSKWAYKKHNESRSTKSCVKHPQNSVSVDKNHTKIKFNFLQESQLTSEQLSNACIKPASMLVVDCSSNDSAGLQKQQMNGLNPSAVEFTPSSGGAPSNGSDKKPTDKQLSTESIEDGIKFLSVAGDNCSQTISNPVVLDEGMVIPPYNYPFYDSSQYSSTKMPPTDSSTAPMGVPSIYPYPGMPLARPMSHINYTPTQTIVPQFQVALYGNNPQLIRYNHQSQNVPINIPGGYLVYSPVMINGMYNSLLSNRLYPMSATDIPAAANLSAQFAHPFNNTAALLPGSNNGAHQYFAAPDSITSHNSTHHHLHSNNNNNNTSSHIR